MDVVYTDRALDDLKGLQKSDWGAMYTWLDALDSDDLDKAKAGCQQKLAEAQAFKDAGYLT